MKISYFTKVRETQPAAELNVTDYFEQIKTGKYIDAIITLRNLPTEPEQAEFKKTLPAVTGSGLFGNSRSAANLKTHSGLIVIDFDHLADINATRQKLQADKYTFACYASARGNGLAVWVKINPQRHLDSFLGLEAYYANNYHLQADPACKDVSRARFASYDPELYYNAKSETFKEYIEKRQQKFEAKRHFYGDKDIAFILDQIQRRGADIAPDYASWLRCGYALTELGQQGLAAFEIVSSQHGGRQSISPEVQFKRCARSTGHGVTIATFFYYCKQSGIDISTPESKKVKAVGIQRRRSNATIEDAAKYLADFEQIPESESAQILNQIWNAPLHELSAEDVSELDRLEVFIRSNYNLKRNLIDRMVFNEGRQVDNVFINSVYLQAMREVNEKISFNLVERVIFSDFVKDYNPIHDFIAANRAQYENDTTDYIKQIAECLESDNPKFTEHFLRKWLVGIGGSAMGTYSITVLVLIGEMGINKTNFFRNLLPHDLKVFYAESKLDRGKDDEILMTRKLLIMDDEFAGKSKKETESFKSTTSKETFTLREPYGRVSVELSRLAVLAGTANEDEILNDYTGNRRIIPIRVRNIDFQKYNAVDKTGLFMQIIRESQTADWFLSKADIAYLNEMTTAHKVRTPEFELINAHLTKPAGADAFSPFVENLTSSEIRVYIENITGQRLNPRKFSEALKEIGFISTMKKVNGVSGRFFEVIKNKSTPGDGSNVPF